MQLIVELFSKNYANNEIKVRKEIMKEFHICVKLLKVLEENFLKRVEH